MTGRVDKARLAVAFAALAPVVVGCDGDSDVNPSDAVEAGAPGNVDASIPTNLRFRKLTLHREFYCEGASYGDLDADGDTDVIAGPHWYEGPDFTAQHAIWTAGTFDPTYYSDCFFQWVRDFNGDALLDVLVVGFPGADASWFENPGVTDGAWVRHRVIDVVDNESPEFGDITGDGDPELLYASDGRLGWAGPDPADATLPWQFHALSDVRGLREVHARPRSRRRERRRTPGRPRGDGLVRATRYPRERPAVDTP